MTTLRGPLERGEPQPRQAMHAALETQLGQLDLPEKSPPSIPDHQLLERIGVGAYGEVWRARNALGTFRAVKLVYRARFEEERPYRREFNGILKYEPISRSHENLVQILHVGRNEEAGLFYYVMELADDANAPAGGAGEDAATLATEGEARKDSGPYKPRTLRADLAGSKRWAPREAALVALRLTEALGHLHAHGLVHRDVKPSNVIFVGGRPKLADIGLVTSAGDSLSFVGTEGFIPPEGPGTPQADLYGLGKLLYEMATGRDRMDFPQLPAGISDTAESQALLDLNEILLRACAHEADMRYRTAADMKADLGLFLGGHNLREVRRSKRRVVQLKRLAVVACVLLAIVAGSLRWSRMQQREATQRERLARDRAQREAQLRQRAEAAEQDARHQLYAALVEQADAMVQSPRMGHRVGALTAIRKAAAITNSTELRRAAFSALALPDLSVEQEMPVGPEITLCRLDPQFDRAAVCSINGPLEVRSLTDQHLIASLPATRPSSVYMAGWSRDGRFLAVKREVFAANGVSDLEIWEIAGPKRVLLLKDAVDGTIAFHPSAPLVVATRRPALLATFDLATGQELDSYSLDYTPALLTLSPEGERFAIASRRNDGWVVSVRQLSNGQEISSHLFTDLVAGLDWHPSGNWLGIADYGGRISLMDPQTGETRTLGRHKAQAVCAVFSPDGRYLVSGGWERELIGWELSSKERVLEMDLGSYWLQFSADGQRCATVSKTMEQTHSFERPTACRALFEELGGRVRRATFSPNGRWLAVAGNEHLAVWDLAGNGPGSLVGGPTEFPSARPVFSSGNSQLFVGSDETCSRWTVSPGANPWSAPQLKRLDFPSNARGSFSILSNEVVFTSSQGSRVVAAGEGQTAAGPWVATSPGENGASADGHWLAVHRPFKPDLHIYRMPGFEPVQTLINQDNILSFQFSPDAREVAVCSNDRVELWSTDFWQRTRELPGFMGLLFSPEGESFWLTKDYRRAGLYDARTLELLLPLPLDTLPLALSPDGKQLAVSVDAHRVQVWNLPAVRERFGELGISWSASPAPRK